MSDQGEMEIVACFRDEQGRLILRDSLKREYRDVRPLRMFPITDPDGCISICDAQFNELICIQSIGAIPQESREIFEQELNRCMFNPIIHRITGSKVLGDNVRLSLVTDRGATDIVIDSEEIYRLSQSRILIKDLSGIRYLIPDWGKMGSQSRKILDIYL